MSEHKEIKRRSVVHFLIKPKLQIKFTLLFILAALISSFCTVGVIFMLTRIDVDGLEGWRIDAHRYGFLQVGDPDSGKEQALLPENVSCRVAGWFTHCDSWSHL